MRFGRGSHPFVTPEGKVLTNSVDPYGPAGNTTLVPGGAGVGSHRRESQGPRTEE